VPKKYRVDLHKIEGLLTRVICGKRFVWLLYIDRYVNIHLLFLDIAKVYVQQLESSHLKLMQLEQELKHARQQVQY
ncbi:hypothetical protein HN873_051614, partial [Arachis hypogaea]